MLCNQLINFSKSNELAWTQMFCRDRKTIYLPLFAEDSLMSRKYMLITCVHTIKQNAVFLFERESVNVVSSYSYQSIKGDVRWLDISRESDYLESILYDQSSIHEKLIYRANTHRANHAGTTINNQKESEDAHIQINCGVKCCELTSN